MTHRPGGQGERLCAPREGRGGEARPPAPHFPAWLLTKAAATRWQGPMNPTVLQGPQRHPRGGQREKEALSRWGVLHGAPSSPTPSAQRHHQGGAWWWNLGERPGVGLLGGLVRAR